MGYFQSHIDHSAATEKRRKKDQSEGPLTRVGNDDDMRGRFIVATIAVAWQRRPHEHSDGKRSVLVIVTLGPAARSLA